MCYTHLQPNTHPSLSQMLQFDPPPHDVAPDAIAQVVAVGSLLAQSLGLSVLSWLFLTRNEYYKMSSLANTGMLPTNNFRND